MFRVDGGLIFLHVDQEFPVKILAQNFVFVRTKFIQNVVVLEVKTTKFLCKRTIFLVSTYCTKIFCAAAAILLREKSAVDMLHELI